MLLFSSSYMMLTHPTYIPHSQSASRVRLPEVTNKNIVFTLSRSQILHRIYFYYKIIHYLSEIKLYIFLIFISAMEPFLQIKSSTGATWLKQITRRLLGRGRRPAQPSQATSFAAV